MKKLVRPKSLRLEALQERLNPVVVNGTAGHDVVTTELLFQQGAPEPHAANILLNGTVAATVNITHAHHLPSTSWFIDTDLTINGLGGNDRVEIGLIRPVSGSGFQVNGGAGNDTLIGGNGKEYLVGGPGADDMHAGIDEDILTADMADTRLVGGGGQDRLVMTVAGFVRITDTTLIMGGRTLSTAAGTYGGFFAIHLDGSNGNDVLDASGFTNVVVELFGRGGNDLLASGATSRTTLDGGAGNDILLGSPEADALGGGPGNDYLFGGNDTFPDFTSNILGGGAGSDTLVGGTAPNSIYGGTGNDHMVGGPRTDYLYGEQGNDILTGAEGNDFLYGDGDDSGTPPTYSGSDSFDGGADDDVLVADGADRQFVGGVGIDNLVVSGARGTVTLTDTTWRVGARRGTAAGLEFATIGGSPANDTIDVTGFSGPTSLAGLSGKDTLRAGPGGATLDGGPGIDILVGAAGNDLLYGDTADTQFTGGVGEDSLSVANIAGSAVLTDTSLFVAGRTVPTSGFESVTLYGDDGANTLDAAVFTGFANLYGNGGNDSLLGGSGGSYLSGGTGNDSLTGGSGNDTLYGDDGTDTLNSGGGDDTIDGGAETDDLTGGTGADQFVKDADSGVNAIEIAASDFNAGEGDTEL